MEEIKMRMMPKAKPVGIRITSCGLEHSSIESLRNNFSLKDLLSHNDGRLERWLRQLNEDDYADVVRKDCSLFAFSKKLFSDAIGAKKIRDFEEMGIALFDKNRSVSVSVGDCKKSLEYTMLLFKNGVERDDWKEVFTHHNDQTGGKNNEVMMILAELLAKTGNDEDSRKATELTSTLVKRNYEPAVKMKHRICPLHGVKEAEYFSDNNSDIEIKLSLLLSYIRYCFKHPDSSYHIAFHSVKDYLVWEYKVVNKNRSKFYNGVAKRFPGIVSVKKGGKEEYIKVDLMPLFKDENFRQYVEFFQALMHIVFEETEEGNAIMDRLYSEQFFMAISYEDDIPLKGEKLRYEYSPSGPKFGSSTNQVANWFLRHIGDCYDDLEFPSKK